MDIGLGRLTDLTLESRFTDLDRPVLLSGIQALVRVLLEQQRLDREAGRHTAGLVSGYRGSPLGGLDQELWRQQKLLGQHDIRFQPGLNEDLAATMLWGAQQIAAFPKPKFDGVFGMWYGKGPGVDRSGDALHCATMLGTAKLGGVLAVAGDDHGAHSSTYPHQTEPLFAGWFIPVLNPASVQDILDLGLAGIALSRFCGLWVALKTTAETAEQASTALIRAERNFATPDFPIPPHGLNYDPSLSFPADRFELERRVMEERIPAARAWARANRLDRLIFGAPDAPIGIVTVGKAHTDTLHALRRLGLADHPQLALYKVGLTWPLETEGLRDFARGKRALLVVEEKRSFVESQIRDALYNLPADERPSIAGKTDARGAPLLSPLMELSPESVGASLSRFLGEAGLNVPTVPAYPHPERPAGLLRRVPAFCAGCPHGTSTQLPDGSLATAGIGCHFMALDHGAETRTFTHMGGEGVTWVGLAPFTGTPHAFANIGDGTYTHSGILAIRQAVAANAPVTYKILVNDAVAMTGGQPAEGHYTVAQIAAQVAAEGVSRIAVVADEEDRLPAARLLPPGTTRHTRESLDQVQRELREHPGVSVLIYDQVCATEKRRRRKRGKMAEPKRSVLINPEICENCGDCSTQSRCIAIEPIETKLGRKRRINPTACNVDLSCLKGFCPSFVTVDGPPRAPDADAHWETRETELAAGLTLPRLPDKSPWRALFAGIGGGGIVTAGKVLAMAAHIEGRDVHTLDFTGLAQKNGTVVAHVQIGAVEDLDVVRIPLGEADLLLAADLAVGAGPNVLERCAARAAVIGNLDLAASADFKFNPNLSIDAGLHRRTIERATDAHSSLYLHGERIAERLFGNAQAMNTMLLGIAWQKGLIPVGEAAILRAIELNGAAVKLNQRAFLWGRILAERPSLADEIVNPEREAPPADLDALIADRTARLTTYQSARYARRYRERIEEVRQAEARALGAPGVITRAAAENLFRVMAYKDEYEVARMHLAHAGEYGAKPAFHMAPPLLTAITGWKDKATGRPRKIALPGTVALPLFRLLRHGKRLRGTVLDPFGHSAERRWERGLADAYMADLRAALAKLRRDNVETVRAIAELPDQIRGFGPVKEANRRKAEGQRAVLMARLDEPAAPPVAIAAE
ncbi:MAG TPA: indolepyruvate ferredoxin oxidoreductase family protein [Acetobacteraceae bacterium]|nr:indolepyruvate ferredoxin oxidoreductase family protein [Acetobacteraceae bacterium]